MLVAFCDSPVLCPPKSPIAAKLNVWPGVAAVRSEPLPDALPLVTEYKYVVAADSPDTATAWCWRVPAGSITVFPAIETTPDVGMLVHQETMADVPVTLDRYGPL